MPRKLVIGSSEYPFHVTNRSNNKDFFSLPLDELWDLFMSIFAILKEDYGCNLLQFVLMSNHFHLMIHTPNNNLSAAMLYLHREVAKRANAKSQRMNHFFGGRYRPCLIDTEHYFWNCVKYVLRNPVEAGICSRVEEYCYSTFKNQSSDFLLTDFFNDLDKKIDLDLDWLNLCFADDQKRLMRKSLTKQVFTIHKSKHRKLPVLEKMPGT